MQRTLATAAVALAALTVAARADAGLFSAWPFLVALPAERLPPSTTPEGGVLRCAAEGATIQASPSGYAIGTCPPGESLQRVLRSAPYQGRFWDGGYVGGGFDGCGWVKNDAKSLPGVSTGASSCRADTALGALTPSRFAAVDNNGPTHGACNWKPDPSGTHRCTDGSPTRTASACTAYGNFRPWASGQQPTDPVRELRAGARVRWRYITRWGSATDGRPLVMVREWSGPRWMFVPYACIDGFPGWRPVRP